MVWYGIQLAMYINKYTPLPRHEFDERRSDPINNPIIRVYLRTGSGKAHEAMRNAAHANHMKQWEDPEAIFWRSEWSIDIVPPAPVSDTTLTGIDHKRPLIIHGVPFEGNVTITDTKEETLLYVDCEQLIPGADVPSGARADIVTTSHPVEVKNI